MRRATDADGRRKLKVAAMLCFAAEQAGDDATKVLTLKVSHKSEIAIRKVVES